ncbi:MAG: gliding motility-associated protein GldE [Brumimicrobium sp.]
MADSIPPAFLLNITTSSIDFALLGAISILLVCLLISVVVSATEVALYSLSIDEKKSIKESENSNLQSVAELLKSPKDLLATILIINIFANVGMVIFTMYISQNYFGDALNPLARILIEIVGITFLILLAIHILPKIFAYRNSFRLIKMLVKPINTVGKIPPFLWFRKLLVNVTDSILHQAHKSYNNVAADDLETAVALAHESNVSDEEQKILEGIVNFGNTDVRQIMRSRVDMVAVDEQATFSEILNVILESGYSRMPVYRESLDNVIGILFIKDLLKYLNEKDDFKWQEIVRPPFFVPENKKIDNLLKEFQETKVHMAVVVDEYGGSSGVVTLEDVLEEIVGEITDEFDDDNIIYTKIDENTFLFEGKTSLVDMYKILDIDGKDFEEEKGESDSIGGFLIEHVGRILKNNEKFEFGGFRFIVESSDKKRIKMVKVIQLQEDDEGN